MPTLNRYKKLKGLVASARKKVGPLSIHQGKKAGTREPWREIQDGMKKRYPGLPVTQDMNSRCNKGNDRGIAPNIEKTPERKAFNNSDKETPVKKQHQWATNRLKE